MTHFNDDSFLREKINELAGSDIKKLRIEITKYIDILPLISDSGIRIILINHFDSISSIIGINKRTFNDPSLIIDPMLLPDILILAEEIKENNFNYFTRNFNTDGYFHHEHGEILGKLIERLNPLSNRIRANKLAKLNHIFDKTLTQSDSTIVSPDKNFVKIDFVEYGLPEFSKSLKYEKQSNYINNIK